VLGVGGYGCVYLATDRLARNRRVAIKKAVILDSDMRTTFEQEATIMRDLDHPNICKVFESYDEGRNVFLVMEYCEGGTLLDRVVEHERLEEVVAADITHQVASALKYAHGRGIAHRDLKAENVCFCSKDLSNNHVKVIDWGVGACFTGLRRMRSCVGSAAYSAPEVIEGKSCYTAACDLWSLGIIMFVMLTGELPFGEFGLEREAMNDDDEDEILCMPALESIPAWRSIPEQARNLIRGLLQQDPLERAGVDDVISHEWLVRREDAASGLDSAAARQILSNVQRFGEKSSFSALCAAVVVRQLDAQHLEGLRQVFREMDTNGDGVLQLHEVRAGFERLFGDVNDGSIGELFTRLDLDGSGCIDYTEFCAAGLGAHLDDEVGALKAAFRSFDVFGSDGRLTKEEIQQVLANADISHVWSPCSLEGAACSALEHFDLDGDGSLNFGEWRRLLRGQSGLSDVEEPTLDASGEEDEDFWSPAPPSARTRLSGSSPEGLEETLAAAGATSPEGFAEPGEEKTLESNVGWGLWEILRSGLSSMGLLGPDEPGTDEPAA